MAFEAFLEQNRSRPRRQRRLTHLLSLAVHGAVLVTLGILTLRQAEEVPAPRVSVSFMAALAPPPPPPPPPPAAAAAKSAPEKKPSPKPEPKPVVEPQPVVQPEPEEPEPETAQEPEPLEEPEAAQAEAGQPNGMSEGGVVGGVTGGVEGGVVGGLAAGPPGPPAPERTPVMLPPTIGIGQRITDVEDPRFRPTLPKSHSRPGAVLWGLFKICVAPDGKVADVKVVRSADPLVDPTWIAKIRLWEYRPYSIDGRNVPFCHVMRIQVTSAA